MAWPKKAEWYETSKRQPKSLILRALKAAGGSLPLLTVIQ